MARRCRQEYVDDKRTSARLWRCQKEMVKSTKMARNLGNSIEMVIRPGQ